MRRIPAIAVVLLLAAFCAGVLVLLARLREHGRSLTDWLSRLPPGEAVVVYLDFGALRRAGLLELLDLTRLEEEPEYRAFVEQSGFDPRVDLEAALIAFHSEGNYFLLRGRFDWRSLNQFVNAQGGACYNSFCRVAGSRPERRISYFPLRPDVMAMAVSQDGWAASRWQTRWRSMQPGEIPDHPVWALIPAQSLAQAGGLPPGTRLFAKALGSAERIVFSATPAGDHMELHVDVVCRSTQDGAALVAQLRGLTEALREMIAREKQQPNPRDLSGVLTAGVFEQAGRRVRGRWPLSRPFLESLWGTTR